MSGTGVIVDSCYVHVAEVRQTKGGILLLVVKVFRAPLDIIVPEEPCNGLGLVLDSRFGWKKWTQFHWHTKNEADFPVVIPSLDRWRRT